MISVKKSVYPVLIHESFHDAFAQMLSLKIPIALNANHGTRIYMMAWCVSAGVSIKRRRPIP